MLCGHISVSLYLHYQWTGFLKPFFFDSTEWTSEPVSCTGCCMGVASPFRQELAFKAAFVHLVHLALF